MDPVETKDEHVLEAKEKVEKVLRAMDPKLSIHDFRMVPGTDQINLIFDLVVPFEYDQKKQDHIRSAIMGVLQICRSKISVCHYSGKELRCKCQRRSINT